MKKKKKLLRILSESKEKWWNSPELAEEIGVSQRTVLRYMKELKTEEADGGYELQSQKGKGYYFRVVDEEKFYVRLEENTNVQEILWKLLFEETCKIDDLTEKYHYSRSGIAGILNKVTEEVEQHGLQLIGKPYVGLMIYGNEIYIRNYAWKLLENETEEKAARILGFTSENREKVATVLSKRQEIQDQKKRQEKKNFFLKYLGIQLARIRMGKTICTGFFTNLNADRHFQDDLKVAKQILGLCGVEEKSRYEMEEVYLALIYRQAFWQNGIVDSVDEKNLSFYQKIVESALNRIRRDCRIEFLKDETLVNGLILHIASSYRKYLLGMETENYFHNTMLESYPTAYYFAVEVAKEISGYTGLPLSKYEISFLGMHFASFLERNLQSRNWKVALVCQSGFGTAQLLKSRLIKFYNHLEIAGVFSLEEGEKVPDEIDFLITTVPLTEEQARKKAWIQVSPMLPAEEQISLERMFQQMSKKTPQLEEKIAKYFLHIKGVRDKTELMLKVCDRYVERQRISPKEKEGILEREKLVSTEIVEGVAMPHGLIEGESFLSFIILDEPVVWGRTTVKLVILGCFQRGDDRMKEELEQLFKMLLDERIREEMLSCVTEKQLEEKINGYYERS